MYRPIDIVFVLKLNMMYLHFTYIPSNKNQINKIIVNFVIDQIFEDILQSCSIIFKNREFCFENLSIWVIKMKIMVYSVFSFNFLNVFSVLVVILTDMSRILLTISKFF